MNDYQAAMREIYEEGRRAGLEQAARAAEPWLMQLADPIERRLTTVQVLCAIRTLADDTRGRDAD